MLTTDLPGVTREHLDVRVDKHILTIQAQTGHKPAAEPTYREYELVNVFRQFELSDEMDEETISADLKHGVLTLKVPKHPPQCETSKLTSAAFGKAPCRGPMFPFLHVSVAPPVGLSARDPYRLTACRRRRLRCVSPSSPASGNP